MNGTLLGKALWTLRLVSIDGVIGGTRLPEDRGSAGLSSLAISWIDERSGDEPWFAYLHGMEPHTPYDPPAPFRGRFADPAYAGPEASRPPGYQGFLPFEEAPALPAPELEHLVARYDEALSRAEGTEPDLACGSWQVVQPTDEAPNSEPDSRLPLLKVVDASSRTEPVNGSSPRP